MNVLQAKRVQTRNAGLHKKSPISSVGQSVGLMSRRSRVRDSHGTTRDRRAMQNDYNIVMATVTQNESFLRFAAGPDMRNNYNIV